MMGISLNYLNNLTKIRIMARSLVIIASAFIFVVCIGLSFTAPLEDSKQNSKQNIAERFVEFLKQDSQISELLNKHGLQPIRTRRDTEMFDIGFNDTSVLESAGTEGFFDRAAKFVMEVLQRFLKWINSD